MLVTFILTCGHSFMKDNPGIIPRDGHPAVCPQGCEHSRIESTHMQHSTHEEER